MVSHEDVSNVRNLVLGALTLENCVIETQDQNLFLVQIPKQSSLNSVLEVEGVVLLATASFEDEDLVGFDAPLRQLVYGSYHLERFVQHLSGGPGVCSMKLPTRLEGFESEKLVADLVGAMNGFVGSRVSTAIEYRQTIAFWFVVDLIARKPQRYFEPITLDILSERQLASVESQGEGFPAVTLEPVLKPMIESSFSRALSVLSARVGEIVASYEELYREEAAQALRIVEGEFQGEVEGFESSLQRLSRSGVGTDVIEKQRKTLQREQSLRVAQIRHHFAVEETNIRLVLAIQEERPFLLCSYASALKTGQTKMRNWAVDLYRPVVIPPGCDKCKRIIDESLVFAHDDCGELICIECLKRVAIFAADCCGRTICSNCTIACHKCKLRLCWEHEDKCPRCLDDQYLKLIRILQIPAQRIVGTLSAVPEGMLGTILRPSQAIIGSVEKLRLSIEPPRTSSPADIVP